MHCSPSNNTDCGSKPSKISDSFQKGKRKGFLPKIHNNVRHENEQWAIKALPTDWEPVYSSSTILQALAEKREMEHNKRLARMETDMSDINSKVECRVRIKSQWIKEEYRNIQNKSEAKITEKLKDDASKLCRFKRDDFDEILKAIQELHDHYLDSVKEFYKYLLQLERTRCHHLKNILRDSFAVLHEVAFQLPKELQETFEHKILHINQITLSNLRCYHDICSTLQLQGENSLRRWLQAVNSLKCKWKTIQKEQATQKLYDFRKSSDAENLHKEISKNVNIQFDLKQKEAAFSSSLSQLMLVPIQTNDVSDWCSAVELEIKDLGSTTKTIVNLYRGAIIQVFNGYMEEFQNISQRMIENGVFDDSELDQFNKEVAVPIIDEISLHLSSSISDIKNLWDEVSSALEKQARTTVSFLRSAALIWDMHFGRLDVLKTAILKELEQVIKINSQLSEKKEANICISIDIMRQGSNKTSLDNELTDLNLLLDQLQEVYVEDCQRELAVINKYPDLAQDETELLINELRQFLNAYPKKIGEIRRASRCTIPEEPELVLPAQMKMCQYEVEALGNWMLGLWEAIDKYLLTCETELAEKAEQWKDSHVKRILKRLEVKIAFHKARYDRTRINIYDTRRAELEAHAERFERHKMEIGIQMQEMSTATATFGNKLQIILENECEGLEEQVMKKVEATKSSLAANAIAYEVDVIARKLENCADDIVSDYIDIIQDKQNKIFESNHEFRKSIKLFSEDGNFSKDEAKRYFNELKKLETNLEKKVLELQKEIDAKHQKLKAAIQQNHLNLGVMLKLYKEELEFREQVIKEIRQVQSNIKICIYDKKYTLKRLSAEIRRLKHPVFSTIENFSRFKTNFTDLVERMLGFEMYLLKVDHYTDSDSERSSSRNLISKKQSMAKRSRTASRVSSRASSSKSRSRSRLSSFASSTGTDYTYLIYSMRPPDTCTFMTELNTALFESLDTIQRMAKRFYRKDRAVRNTELLQPTLVAFMEEVVRKYKYYKQQVEKAWMDVVNETLKLLKQLLHFIWRQSEIILENFYEAELVEVNKQRDEKLHATEKVKDQYEQENESLHGRLKIHYGYQNNKPMLDLLVKEADNLKQKLKIQDIYDWFHNYKNIQEEARNDFLRKLNSLEEELETLKSVGFNLVNERLIAQFEENLPLNKRKSVSSAKKEKSWCTLSDISSRYESFKSQSKVLSENKSTTTQKNTLVSSTSFIPQNVPKNSLMDIDEDIIYEQTLTKDGIVKEYDEELNKRVELVIEIKSSFDIALQKWTKIWTSSKEKVLKLYALKYDNA